MYVRGKSQVPTGCPGDAIGTTSRRPPMFGRPRNFHVHISKCHGQGEHVNVAGEARPASLGMSHFRSVTMSHMFHVRVWNVVAGTVSTIARETCPSAGGPPGGVRPDSGGGGDPRPPPPQPGRDARRARPARVGGPRRWNVGPDRNGGATLPRPHAVHHSNHVQTFTCRWSNTPPRARRSLAPLLTVGIVAPLAEAGVAERDAAARQTRRGVAAGLRPSRELRRGQRRRGAALARAAARAGRGAAAPHGDGDGRGGGRWSGRWG